VFPVFKQPKQEGDYRHPQIDELSFNHRLPGRAMKEEGLKGDKTPRFALSFYPEGGDLVQGLPCRVAFSATDKEGKRAKIHAALVDGNNEILDVVESDVTGRGVFELTPGEQPLKVVVTDEDLKRYEYTLPTAKAEGCALRVNTENDIVATLYASPSMQGRMLGYTLMNNGNVVRADTMMALPGLEFSFERSKVPAGVNQLTVFDSDGRIQAERLFFICPPATLDDSVRVGVPTTELKPCGRIRLDLTATPGSQLSLSAMDAATLPNGHVGNARTWMLLASEVRGYIENPDYYFEADDAEHRKAADMLMMVQGWRRYDWQLHAGSKRFDELEDYTGRVQPIEDKLYVFGQLKPDRNKWRKKHPVNGVDLTAFLYNQSGAHMDGSCVTDSVGGYAFEMPDVTGEWNLQIKTKYDGKDARYVVAIDRHFSPKARLLAPYEVDMIPLPKDVEELKKQKALAEEDEKDNNTKITGSHGNYVLPTVKVKARHFTDTSKLPWYDEKTGARKSSIYYNVDEATDYIADQGEPLPTLYEWLKQKNAFFQGTNSLDDRYVVVDDTTGKLMSVMDGGMQVDTAMDYQRSVYKDGLTYKSRPILWIVNNAYNTITYYPLQNFLYDYVNGGGVQPMPTFIDEVKSVYVSEDDENYTKFIRSNYVERIHPITVFVYTHPQFTVAAKGLRRTHFQGYNVPTEFKMEDYSVMPPMDDFRRTLFWAPNVQVGDDGKAHVEFFNNSSCTQMYISAEGMTPQGNFVVNE
jgi:hypothetical protein